MNVTDDIPHSRRALLVVTDPAIRQLCGETLAAAGFAISNGLESGAAAVVSARDQSPDIILLSQQLNDVPASEAVKWLRSNPALAATPIVILGGKPNATHDGLTVLPRPITGVQLRQAIDRIVPEEDRNHRVAR